MLYKLLKGIMVVTGTREEIVIALKKCMGKKVTITVDGEETTGVIKQRLSDFRVVMLPHPNHEGFLVQVHQITKIVCNDKIIFEISL